MEFVTHACVKWVIHSYMETDYRQFICEVRDSCICGVRDLDICGVRDSFICEVRHMFY